MLSAGINRWKSTRCLLMFCFSVLSYLLAGPKILICVDKSEPYCSRKISNEMDIIPSIIEGIREG